MMKVEPSHNQEQKIQSHNIGEKIKEDQTNMIWYVESETEANNVKLLENVKEGASTETQNYIKQKNMKSNTNGKAKWTPAKDNYKKKDNTDTFIQASYLISLAFFVVWESTPFWDDESKAWITYITTWTLPLSSFYYLMRAIMCVYGNSHFANNIAQIVANSLSNIVHIINPAIAIYFLVVLYPEVEKPIDSFVFFLYAFPAAVTFLDALITNKDIKIQDIIDPIMFSSVYLITTMFVTRLTTGKFEGGMTCHVPRNTFWICGSFIAKTYDILLSVMFLTQVALYLFYLTFSWMKTQINHAKESFILPII